LWCFSLRSGCCRLRPLLHFLSRGLLDSPDRQSGGFLSFACAAGAVVVFELGPSPNCLLQTVFTRPHRRCWLARPNPREWWSSRLVATAAESRLSYSRLGLVHAARGRSSAGISAVYSLTRRSQQVYALTFRLRHLWYLVTSTSVYGYGPDRR